MEKSHNLCTQDQAVRLASLGLMMDTYFAWDTMFLRTPEEWRITDNRFIGHSYIPAPDSDELSVKIPAEIDIEDQSYHLIFRKTIENGKEIYVCDVVDASDHSDWYFDFKNDHLAWLMADIVIWLFENKHIGEQDTIDEAEIIERMHRS